MKTKNTFVCLVLSLFFLSSCSHRLVGTWTVKTYERTTPGEQGVSLSNIGTMTFESDNTGMKELDYTVLGIKKDDTAPFTWSATEKYVTIEGDDSDLTKTWIYMENDKKYQKWQSTDGANNVQTLELTKE